MSNVQFQYYQWPMAKIQNAILLVGIWSLVVGVGHWIFDVFLNYGWQKKP